MHEPPDKAGSVHCTEMETGKQTALLMAYVPIYNICLILQYDVPELAQATFYIHCNPLHTLRRTDHFCLSMWCFRTSEK